jgi:predicted GIY-YIG superfamily endonuclease
MNVDKRLRQHNKEIKGGARYTGKWVDKGDSWTRVCYVSGFPDWVAALQFEWKWKKLSSTIKHKVPLQRNLEALTILLASDKSTSSSIPFSDWPLPIEVHEEKQLKKE